MRDTTIKGLVEDRMQIVPMRRIDDVFFVISRGPDRRRFVGNWSDKDESRRKHTLDGLRVSVNEIQIEAVEIQTFSCVGIRSKVVGTVQAGLSCLFVHAPDAVLLPKTLSFKPSRFVPGIDDPGPLLLGGKGP